MGETGYISLTSVAMDRFPMCPCPSHRQTCIQSRKNLRHVHCKEKDSWLEVAIRLEAIALRFEAIALSLEAIALGLEAIATRREEA